MGQLSISRTRRIVQLRGLVQITPIRYNRLLRRNRFSQTSSRRIHRECGKRLGSKSQSLVSSSDGNLPDLKAISRAEDAVLEE